MLCGNLHVELLLYVAVQTSLDINPNTRPSLPYLRISHSLLSSKVLGVVIAFIPGIRTAAYATDPIFETVPHLGE